MTAGRKRQLRRQRQGVERRRAAHEHDARETQRQQVAAELRQAYVQHHRRHIAAFSMWALAVILAVSHIFEHTGTLRLMSPGLEDILIGWPMAGVLAVSGAFVYGT